MFFMLIAIVLVATVPAAGEDSFTAIGADANGYAVVINLPEMKLHLYQHGVRIKSYPIGVGHIVSPTNLGRTTIVNKVAHPTYYPPNWYTQGLQPIPPGPENPVGTRWLGLGWPGYGIHGTNAPHSIGTAASSGCIRMHNHDVEELAEIVSVGTPVTFVYQTMLTSADPLTGQPHVTVFPDLYRQGTNTLERALSLLNDRYPNLSGVDEGALAALIAQAEGRPQAVPFASDVRWHGAPLKGAGHSQGGQRLIALDVLARSLNEPAAVSVRGDQVLVFDRLVPRALVWSGRAFAPPESAAHAFGLGWQSTTGPGGRPYDDFYGVTVAVDGGETLSRRGFVDGDRLWIPAEELAARFRVRLEWDDGLGALEWHGRPLFGSRVIGGVAHLPHDYLSELIGVPIRWAPGDSVAQVTFP